jgi:hypothetical protein
MDQALRDHTEANEHATMQRNLASGQAGGGRTLNIPKFSTVGDIPGSSYNSGVTIGAECSGVHCSIPISPASHPQDPSMVRLGNSSLQIQQGGAPSHLQAYGQILDPRTGEMQQSQSERGRHIYRRYLERLYR